MTTRALVAFALLAVASAWQSLPSHADATCPGAATADRVRVVDGASRLDRSSPSACRRDLADLTALLRSKLANGGIVLLGEVHDNPRHHALRAAMIADWGRAAGAVVFEHIRADQQPALDTFARLDATSGRPGTASDLLGLLDWEKSGWPDRQMFEPLFAAVIEAKLPVLPGEAARGEVRKVAKDGDAALAESAQRELHLDHPLPSPLQAALIEEIGSSHCGLMPATAFTNMALAQRYRDAVIARAVSSAAQAHGAAVLLAGNGHVRADRGVPLYLRAGPEHARPVVSVAIVEEEPQPADAAPSDGYGPRDPDGKPATDFVIVTARQERPDPCEEMRRAMSGRKK